MIGEVYLYFELYKGLDFFTITCVGTPTCQRISLYSSLSRTIHLWPISKDLYSQNSVSDVIAAHLKMLLLSFEEYYPEHEDPRRQNIWIVNPFVWKGIYE